MRSSSDMSVGGRTRRERGPVRRGAQAASVAASDGRRAIAADKTICWTTRLYIKDGAVRDRRRLPPAFPSCSDSPPRVAALPRPSSCSASFRLSSPHTGLARRDRRAIARREPVSRTSGPPDPRTSAPTALPPARTSPCSPTARSCPGPPRCPPCRGSCTGRGSTWPCCASRPMGATRSAIATRRK